MENLAANPFFDPEILKLLKKTKPNTSEEDKLKYTSDLMEVIDLVIVDNESEMENYINQSFPIPMKYIPLFVHKISESQEIEGYFKPKVTLFFASQTMECYYHFTAEEQKLSYCPYEKIKILFDGELLKGPEGKAKFIEALKKQNDKTEEFIVPGKMVDLYHKNGKEYEVNFDLYVSNFQVNFFANYQNAN